MADVGHVMGAQIETDMRRDLFSHLQKLSFSFYSDTKIGQLMSRMTSDLFDVTEFAHHCPEEFFIAGLKIGVGYWPALISG
jgi:ATP-binding cassette subfamily B protein